MSSLSRESYQENHIKRRFRNFLSETILGPLEAKLLTHLTAVLLNNNPTGGKEEETMFLQIKLNLITLKTFFRGFYHKQLKYTIASKIAKHMDIGHACMHDHVVSDLSFIYFMLSFKLPKQS